MTSRKPSCYFPEVQCYNCELRSRTTEKSPKTLEINSFIP